MIALIKCVSFVLDLLCEVTYTAIACSSFSCTYLTDLFVRSSKSDRLFDTVIGHIEDIIIG